MPRFRCSSNPFAFALNHIEPERGQALDRSLFVGLVEVKVFIGREHRVPMPYQSLDNVQGCAGFRTQANECVPQ